MCVYACMHAPSPCQLCGGTTIRRPLSGGVAGVPRTVDVGCGRPGYEYIKMYACKDLAAPAHTHTRAHVYIQSEINNEQERKKRATRAPVISHQERPDGQGKLNTHSYGHCSQKRAGTHRSGIAFRNRWKLSLLARSHINTHTHHTDSSVRTGSRNKKDRYTRRRRS